MKITLTIIAAFFILTVAAQDHRNAIGLRGGFSSGVTYRVFVDDFNAFEGWLGFRFYTTPIALSVDYKPFIELSGPYLFHANLHDFGFSVKYTF